jgi:hypothetical protein
MSPDTQASAPRQGLKTNTEELRGGMDIPEKLGPEGLCLGGSEKGQVAGSLGESNVKRIN